MSSQTQRALVGIFPDTDRLSVKNRLTALGAHEVRDPSLELPDVFVVTLSADSDINTFLHRARNIKGVRYAEADTWQTTF